MEGGANPMEVLWRNRAIVAEGGTETQNRGVRTVAPSPEYVMTAATLGVRRERAWHQNLTARHLCGLRACFWIAERLGCGLQKGGPP